MALTTYSKLGALQNLNSEMSNFQQAELAGELLSYADNFDLPNTLLQPLYDPEGFLHPEDYSHLLPYFSPCDPLISLSEVLTTQLDFDPCLYPKRQRCYENEYCSDFTPTFVDGLIPNSCSVPAFLPDGLFSPMPEYCCPQVDCTQNVECLKKTDERVVSAQSIAARERRRKITEKTQELGKMIPGGTKMNTAEMLDAASKYVKYMQAQVGILELMRSFQVCGFDLEFWWLSNLSSQS